MLVSELSLLFAHINEGKRERRPCSGPTCTGVQRPKAAKTRVAINGSFCLKNQITLSDLHSGTPKKFINYRMLYFFRFMAHFIHFHPLSSAFIHFHLLSSIFIHYIYFHQLLSNFIPFIQFHPLHSTFAQTLKLIS